jgi:hypothetical protein
MIFIMAGGGGGGARNQNNKNPIWRRNLSCINNKRLTKELKTLNKMQSSILKKAILSCI